eukprot:176982_1
MSKRLCIQTDIFDISLSRAFEPEHCLSKPTHQCDHHTYVASIVQQYWRNTIATEYTRFVYEEYFDELKFVESLCKQCCSEFIFITNGLKDLFQFIKENNVAKKICFLAKIIPIFVMLFNHEFSLLFILRNKNLFSEFHSFLSDVVNNKIRTEYKENAFVNAHSKSKLSSFICSLSFGVFKMYHKMKKKHLKILSSKSMNKNNLKIDILDLPLDLMDNFFQFDMEKRRYIAIVPFCKSFESVKEYFGDLFTGILFCAIFHEKYFTRQQTLKPLAQRALDTAENNILTTEENLRKVWYGYWHLLSCKYCVLKLQGNIDKYSKLLLNGLKCQYKCCNKDLVECKMKLCSQCKVTYYCSRRCQKKDWKYFHRNICRCVV